MSIHDCFRRYSAFFILQVIPIKSDTYKHTVDVYISNAYHYHDYLFLTVDSRLITSLIASTSDHNSDVCEMNNL